jgi:hypothetical protein
MPLFTHLIPIALCLTVATVMAQGADNPTLAGRSIEVALTGPDKKVVKDTLVFTTDDGDSTACHAYGFGKGPVTYTAQSDGTAFTFSTTSTTDGSMIWKGVATSASASGTMVWTKNGKDQQFSFEPPK